MSSSKSTPQQLVRMIEELSGPTISPPDIEWALDVPAGRQLLDWVTRQVHIPEQPRSGAGAEHGTDHSILWKIALEKGELEIWQRALELSLVTPLVVLTPENAIELPLHPPGYCPPASLRALTSDILSEKELIDGRVDVLERQNKLLQSQSRKLRQDLKSIKQSTQAIRNAILGKETEISELSIRIDSTITAVVQSTRQLISSLNMNDPRSSQDDTPRHPYQYPALLASIVESLNGLSSAFGRYVTATLAEGLEGETNVTDLHLEAARLEAAITSSEKEQSEGTYAKELEEMCKRLENGESWESLVVEADEPSVKDMIEAAWRLDLAKQLKSLDGGLDQAQYLLRHTLIPPTALVHAALARSEDSVQDVWAHAQALVEELDDIAFGDAEAGASPVSDTTSSANGYIEARIRELLMEFHALRFPDTPPPVYIDRVDVLAALKDVHAEYDASIEAESAWCSDVPHAISSLESTHVPLLSALRLHAPLPSKPVLSLPADAQELERVAKAEGNRLMDVIENLQKEVGIDSRGQKKMDSFIKGN
ncbi:hypothetical protein BOTBODRAFT_27530 [Botryobasidium botryosum FD-172 SS1]|uniref:Uncharacterized protein n=1 Tax=Botryobasidium botryosum (strain FD-172 SS1) TaxID=930990 RepID=A0A067MWI8_BOTB1|nr:hypothetical protein BOTBODRAFT_27530 [Botryobasidium botryosum FD-172 SS1]